MEDVQAKAGVSAYLEPTDSVAKVIAWSVISCYRFSLFRIFGATFISFILSPLIHVPAEPASTCPEEPYRARGSESPMRGNLARLIRALVWVRERNFGQGNTCLGSSFPLFCRTVLLVRPTKPSPQAQAPTLQFL
uniref:Uncharacterized protein n=1 Tax=Pleurozia purpurea TaxID=280637 RepID=D0R055_9MARC|nr:hypothetical protein PlpuMp56 [Pleurozia purpurea]ACR19392.1 hypothetical protein PlpuMp56 [Pleurozia purpurea]